MYSLFLISLGSILASTVISVAILLLRRARRRRSAPTTASTQNTAAPDPDDDIEPPEKPPIVENDSDYPEKEFRDRFGRLVVLTVYTAILPAVLPLGFWFIADWQWVSSIKWNRALNDLLSIGVFAGFAEAYLLSIHRFLKIVPNAQALVTQNPFGGYRIPYGPGLHASFPQEQVEGKSNFSLETITDTIIVEMPTKTSLVKVTMTFQYKAYLRVITRLLGVNDSTIKEGFGSFIQSYLAPKLAEKTVEEAREYVDEYNTQLAIDFAKKQTATPTGGTMAGAHYFMRFAILSIILKIAKIELPPAVQKTRDTKDEAEQQLEIVATMYGLDPVELKKKRQSGEMTTEEYNSMLDRALAASEQATMNVTSVHGSAPAVIGAALNKLVEKK